MPSKHYHQANFVLSASKLSHLPPDEGIEVAFAGRSNVGKSSTLNRLANHKKLAKTSKTPGRTQTINLFSLDEKRRLVDLPGYGYAKVSLSVKRQWQQTLASYLETRNCLAGLILLTDIRHPLTELDRNMLDWLRLKPQPIPVHVLLNKSDKLKRNPAMNTLRAVEKELAAIPSSSAQLFSSQTGDGLEGLVNKLDEWYSL